ncbi:MAG: hypothetical protein WBA57_26855 [Elainellaceae cyanobacterium]
MSMHISDFGSLSASVQQYADLDGKVPTVGDRWQDFRWPLHIQKAFAHLEGGNILWEDFLRKAKLAIAQADQQLKDLESADEWAKLILSKDAPNFGLLNGDFMR